MGVVVLVQQIEVWWTKASRGGPGAARRNAVPKSMEPAPAARRARRGQLAHQRLEYREEREFQPVETVEIASLPQSGAITLVGLRIALTPERLEVFYRAGREAGHPERYAPAEPVLRLASGDWGRVQDNGRYSSASGPWRYRQTTWNIGWFSALPDDPWVEPPAKSYSALAGLF